MAAHPVRRSIARLVLAASFALVVLGGSASQPGATATALSGWTGGVDLYRAGVFTTQKTWLWCTAADVQIIRNIARHTADHTRANQQRYFSYMRAHDRYAIPASDGTDPGGWSAGLRHYVDGRYRVVASTSFSAALRSAVTNLRKTNLPVALAVDHGNHGWVLTGFTATADPATTTRFTVTSVRVVGPLWGLQNRTYGYDMRPDRKLTPSQLKGFFTPWHYGRIRMAWEGDWVSIQPIATTASAATSVATPRATTASTVQPTLSPTPAAPSPTMTPTDTAAPAATTGAAAVAAGPITSLSPRAPVEIAPARSGESWDPATVAAFAGVFLVILAGAVLGGRGAVRQMLRGVSAK